MTTPLRRRRALVSTFAAACALAVAAMNSAIAQNAVGEPPDPDPEVERQSFIVADGFEVNLFAADPLIAKPVQMNFDPQGRLWIASSEVYPQIKPGQEANDKILILEDADGDGKAEKTTVFADGLLIPTGVEPGDGGVYVANSTELLHLRDADGDGKADTTRVVLSGFGTEDTHHLLHTLRWGHDGMLYFNQSIYIHSHIETPHGVRRLNGGGIWRFRPETMQLDVFIRGLVNAWGHQVDAWGQSFATDGAGGEGINYCLPGASYVTAVDAARILKGLNPGSPKYCGLEIVGGRHLPDSWQGSMITNDFRGNRVCRFVVSDDGAGFASREQSELIKTKHVSFRPIDVVMGPDGAIYIADWYNPIIQHGEVDFRDPRRDHTRGRIWRVTAKNRPLVERPRLVGADVSSLLAALKSPEPYTRRQAKRVLKERGAAEVVPALTAWVAALDPADPQFERDRLEGLWMFQALDVPRPELLAQTLQSSDSRVRAAAARVVPMWNGRGGDSDSLLAPLVVDDAPRVRLEAVRSLAAVPGEAAAKLAFQAFDKPIDGFLDYALWLTSRDLAPWWLPAVQAGREGFGDGRSLTFALQAVGSPAVLQPLLSLYQQGKVPHEQDAAALNLIATLGGPAELGLLLDMVVKGDQLPPARRGALLNALVNSARERKIVPAGDLAGIASLLANPDESVRQAAIAAAGAWKVEAVQTKLAALAQGVETPGAVRLEALRSLVASGDADSARIVADLAGNQADPVGQTLALASLASSDPRAVADRAAKWLGGLNGARMNEAQAVINSFLDRKEGPSALAKALATVKLDPDLAKLAVREIRATGRQAPSLLEAISRAGGLSDPNRAYSPEDKAAILADAAKADPARGEALFRREDLTCLKCHAVAGAGGQVGPSLESVGASAPVDYLLDSLLEPNKAVKENFHSTVVATDDGRILTGIRVRQTDAQLVLRDAEDREVSIPLSTVEEQKIGGSIMPAGLAEPLTRGELADLVRFLSELGKIGDYAVDKERVLRRWRVLPSTKETATAMIRTSVEAVIQAGDSFPWKPLYTTVGGRVLASETPRIPRVNGAPPISLVHSEVEVTTPGPVRIKFDSIRDLSCWVDGRRVEPDAANPDALTVNLTPGVHALYVGFDPAIRSDGFRCVLEDVEGSPAKARPVLGK